MIPDEPARQANTTAELPSRSAMAKHLDWDELYPQLRPLAHRYLRSDPARWILQTTAVVNEAYVRLAAATDNLDRHRFLPIAARVMRQILVDWARREKAQKREGARTRVPLVDVEARDELPPVDVLDLHAALERLKRGHPRVAEVVDLRFFAGAEMTEIASILNVSRRTVTGDWEFARCWLRRALRPSAANGP